MSIDTFPDTLTAKEAAQQLDVTRGLIELWAKDGCPFLGGVKLTRFANPHSRKGVRYDAAEIAAIQTARSAVSKARDRDYATFEEARKRYKVCRSSLYEWHDKGCCFLNGARLDGHQEMRPVARGNGLRPIWVYNRKQLERIAEMRDRERGGIFEDDKGIWLSAVAAYEFYEIWDASLGDWKSSPCPFLGRIVTHKLMRRLLKSGSYGTRNVYLESDLEAIALAQRQPSRPATYKDVEGTWLFAVEVKRRTGWSASGLWWYRKHPWPFLDGGSLRAKLIPSQHHPCPKLTVKEVWVYHEADVDRVAAMQRGETALQPIAPVALRDGLVIVDDPQTTTARPEKSACQQKRHAGRPSAAERHQQWLEEHESGSSLEQLARKYQVTRRAVVNGIRQARDRRAREINSTPE